MNETTDSVTVVSEREAREAAFNVGYDEGVEGLEQQPTDLSAYRSGAHYINTVLPNLRGIAGFRQTDGPMRDEIQTVVYIPNENEDDEPVKEGRRVDSSDILHDVVLDAFEKGLRAKNRGHGNPYDKIEA